MQHSNNTLALDALKQAATSVVEGLSLSRTLQRIADIARDIVGAQYAALGVPADDGTGLRTFVTSGLGHETADKIGFEPQGLGLLGALMDSNSPIRLNDLTKDARFTGFGPHHPIMRTFLGVPVIGRNNQRLGNIYLCDRIDGQPFNETDENLVVLFASFATIAIENARLHHKLQAAALRDERDRIRMELHDGIIQEIYAVGMKLEIMRGMADLSPEGEQHFHTVLQDLNRIIDDLRAYIRDMSIANKTHASTFQQQLENLLLHFRDFSGITVETQIPDTLPALTDQQRHSLAQIVRESLANIARHANATQTRLTIRLEKNRLNLAIQDNGIGMDLEKTRAPEHYGLRNMEERARRLKGFLYIESGAGQGTSIQVVIPLKQSGLLQH